MKLYTTIQVAKLLGIGRDTLYRWIKAGNIEAPKVTIDGHFKRVVWTDRDVERFRKYKKTNYQSSKARR